MVTGPQALELPLQFGQAPSKLNPRPLKNGLIVFREFGRATRTGTTRFPGPRGERRELPTFINEFWTAKQRQAHSLHEISYRACFKPQLPRCFIDRLTQPGDLVYDPFIG